ncbi:MAG: LAGLIDADG family homing endonuclease [Anaerolineales bacterium]|nr:LAGLIDADG family homing endonuclease [Anaerolineales bacterium]MBX3036519.1 LAGLIDADG family homing endonuclease [Anaerolineales bacterium]
MVSDKELSYIAGLFDGEGSITLVRHRSNRTHSPQVSIASTDYEVVLWCQKRFGGSIVTKQPRKSNHSVSYDWRLTDRQSLEFLKLIRPYLIIERKIRRIDLLLNDYIACTPRNGRYTKEMAERKQALIETFFSLP